MAAVEKVKEPSAVWLPIVLLLTTALPLLIRMPAMGLLTPVPDDVPPVKLTEAVVLLLILVTAPAVIPPKTMP